jgi:hypothetical protein
MKNNLVRLSAVVAAPFMLLASLALLFASVLFSASVQAEDEYVCEARQAASDQLPVLSEQCPIGRGLWGKSRPRKNEDLYWLQCGIFPEPLTLEEVKPIYERISVDVWLRPEGNAFRCLIGPYDDYSAARAEQDLIRRLEGYEEAFIRAVSTKAKKLSQKNPVSAKPAKSKNVQSAPATKPAAKSKPAPVAPAAPEAKPAMVAAKATVKTEAVASDDSLVVRRKAQVKDKQFVIPFLMEGSEQFYMEYNIAWNRLSYAKSDELCQAMGMRLLNDKEWKLLIDSQVMVQKQWPLHLPYWGGGKRGLFTSGKVTQLTGTSLLNVVCVK